MLIPEMSLVKKIPNRFCKIPNKNAPITLKFKFNAMWALGQQIDILLSMSY